MRGIVSIFIVGYQIKLSKSNVFKLVKKAVVFLIVWCIFWLFRSYPTVWAYQYISGSKCILIINVSPVFIVIWGGLFLNEKVSWTNYVAAVVAWIGWYILTLSKSDESVQNSNPFLGYTFAIIAWIARTVTSLSIRIINLCANYMVFPFYYTILLIVMSIFIWMFTDDQINILSYSFIDTILLILASFGTCFGMIFISLGLLHMNASTAAPITNLEVVFAFIADVLIFNYTFFLTDFLGAFIIFMSLSLHILYQIIYIKYQRSSSA